MIDETRRRQFVALLVAGTFFMENLDASVITTALPAMAQSFRVLPAQLSIGLSAYLLTLAVCIPLSGWLTDRIGAGRIFPLAIGVFTAASLACALSESLTVFTAARIAQGLGGAMMVPVGRLVVLRQTQKHDLVRAIAILTWPGLVAPVLGPYVGAVISSALSWHWIFLLNLPLGILAIALSLWLIKGRAQPTGRFDSLGFMLTAVASGGLMSAMDWPAIAPPIPSPSVGCCCWAASEVPLRSITFVVPVSPCWISACCASRRSR